MANTIQVKRGANASLPTLNAGEFGFSTDTHQTYIGDGAVNHELTSKASIWLGAESAYLPITNPASLHEAAASGVYPGWSYLAFDDTTSEHTIWRAPVPDYDGDDITVTAYSKPATTPPGSGYGTEACFNTTNTEYTTVDMLDSTHVVVAYKDTGGDAYGCAKIGVISGSTITWGTEYVFNSANTIDISVAALNSTHFVVTYKDSGGDSYGCARLGVVSSGTVISYGAENIFNSAVISLTSVSALDSTHFVVVYKDNGNSDYGTAIVGETSGGDVIVSYGAENVFNSTTTSELEVSALDSTHFVVAYQNTGSSNVGTGIVGSVASGTTITFGTPNVFDSSWTYHIAVEALDSTHFVIGYMDTGTGNHGMGIVGLTNGGTTISSYGSQNEFTSTSPVYISISKLDSTHFVIGFIGTSRVGTTNGGTTISSYASAITFNDASSKWTSITALDSSDYVVVYKDDSGDDYGCGRAYYTQPSITLQYNILTIGLANSEMFNTPTVVDTGVNLSHSLSDTTLNTDICITSATIDPANVTANDMMIIELSRDVASDNLIGDGQLLGILIEYSRT